MKFVLIMMLCSNVPGNTCKFFEPKYNKFNTYHECARQGYNSAADLMNEFNEKFIDEHEVYIIFSCKLTSKVIT